MLRTDSRKDGRQAQSDLSDDAGFTPASAVAVGGGAKRKHNPPPFAPSGWVQRKAPPRQSQCQVGHAPGMA